MTNISADLASLFENIPVGEQIRLTVKRVKNRDGSDFRVEIAALDGTTTAGRVYTKSGEWTSVYAGSVEAALFMAILKLAENRKRWGSDGPARRAYARLFAAKRAENEP